MTKKVWEQFPRLVVAVKVRHANAKMAGTGHDFDHALQVAQVAAMIAEDEQTRRLAWVAGICHNADRILQHERNVGKKDVPAGDVQALVEHWASLDSSLPPDAVLIIAEAVRLHSGLNQISDHPVLIALMDADRVICSGAENVMTAAQFWRELPALDPKWLVADPSAHDYKNPKSVLRNLMCRRDWLSPASPVCVRLPKARAMMSARWAFIEQYVDRIEAERTELGLWPDYPF